MAPVVSLPWQQSCRWSCLIKAKISRFILNKGPSTPNVLLGRLKTIWELCVFREKPSVPLANVANGDFCFFHRKRLEPRVLPWQQHSRCHFVSVVMYFPGAKFEEHCSNISKVILDSVSYCLSITIYDVITLLICIIQKRKYLENEKRYSKKKKAILLYFENPFK